MDFSTPLRNEPAKAFADQFPEVTPIKTDVIARIDVRDYGFDEAFEDILANDSSFFDNGKRRCLFPCEKEKLITSDGLSPSSRHTNKKVKREADITPPEADMENKVESYNSNMNKCTSDGDLFEEELFDDTFPSFIYRKDENSTCNMNNKKSKDIIENPVETNQLFKLIEKLDNEPIEDNVRTESVDYKTSKEESCHLNVYLEENPVVTTILDKMDSKIEAEKEEGIEDMKENNNTLNGFSQILMESVSKWEKESGICSGDTNDQSSENIYLADKIKQKLMGNVHNVSIKKSDKTGWTQLDKHSNIAQDSVIQNSQYQELGPFFGLPSKVQSLYEKHKGVKELYHWQKECLTLKAVKERRNLVYSLPTSGGKTLVAEILILRELLCFKKNVLFILPFVSIVQEKVHDLSVFGVELGFLVEEYAAGKGVIPLKKRRKRRSVIISTIEKASAVIISLIETNQLKEFGLIVVDELHLVSEDSKRGSTLESLLTLILHVGDDIQVVGMTATIGNLNEMALFLKAESYAGTFRPVELQEHVKCGNDVYAVRWDAEEILTKIQTIKSPPPGPDPDGICELVLETVPTDSALVFCPTRKNCENVAILITEMMPKALRAYKEAEKLSLFKALKSETNGQVCPVMKRTIPFGVVYHHSGLTPGERKLLEEGFRTGTLCVICCTSTLAAGVNLPAARVILRSPYIGKDFISKSKYKQMTGRAGRTGMGCKGESYLICQPSDCEKVGELLRSKMEDSVSKMDSESVKYLILTSIGLGIATCRSELRDLVSRTLLSVQAEKLNVNVKKMVDESIGSLFKMGAIKVKELEGKDETDDINSKLDITMKKGGKKLLRIMNSSQLSVSRLGRAAMKGCIGLERAHELYGDLIKAQSALVLLTELHLLYLVTPYDVVDQIKPNFSVYFNIYMQLSPKELPSAKTIGISEFMISKLATGTRPKGVSESILTRFYAALMLNELLKQQNIWEVARLFEISAGTIQTLMTSASTFANNVLRFCNELSELWCFKSLLNDFAPRLAHCCSAELLPLMELPAVKRGRAKQLYDAGFKNLNVLAAANVNDLVRSVDHLPKRVATEIVAAARLLLLEKAENLKEEAEEVLEGLADKAIPE